VYFEGSKIMIEDFNSASGILVNDYRVFLRSLQDKDAIKAGQTKIYFSTETLDSIHTLEVDLVNKSLEEFDMQQLINTKDTNFKFPSTDEHINHIYDIARQKFALLPLNEMEKINLDAALNEAVGNAQRHGHKFNPKLVIEFRYILKPEKLVLRVTDQGEGFDYRAELQRKKAGTAVEEARARYKAGGYGGLGIMLMLKCANSVEYNRKGNQVTLTKYLGDAAKKFVEDQKAQAAAEASAAKNEPKAEVPEIAADAIPDDGVGIEIHADEEVEPPSKNPKKDDDEDHFVIQPD
jgi:serine/threonine-protein kinase RsbW